MPESAPGPTAHLRPDHPRPAVSDPESEVDPGPEADAGPEAEFGSEPDRGD